MCATFFSRDPLLQAAFAVAILFLSYVAQAAQQPFVQQSHVSPAKLSELVAQVGSDRVKGLVYVFNYNALEQALLGTSMLTLIAGIAFSSMSLEAAAPGPAAAESP